MNTTSNSTRAATLADAILDLPAADQDRMRRVVLRMANGSQRVERLGRMLDAGQITARQFLDLAGR